MAPGGAAMTHLSVTLSEAVALFGDLLPNNRTGFAVTIVDANKDDLNLMAGRACLLCDQAVSKPFRVLLITSTRLRCERPICLDCDAAGSMAELVDKFNECLVNEFHVRRQ
jgi:hypothetical protein